jgi:hypothetical protein
MTEHIHERGHRTGHARLFLAVVFVLQRVADAGVIWFTFQPVCTSSLLRGIAIGSFVWTTALLVGVWRRLSWARYLLTTINWLYVAAFSYALLKRWTPASGESAAQFLPPAAGVILYVAANVILIKSRRVRHFASS